jgi:hypothetical protein
MQSKTTLMYSTTKSPELQLIRKCSIQAERSSIQIPIRSDTERESRFIIDCYLNEVDHGHGSAPLSRSRCRGR